MITRLLFLLLALASSNAAAWIDITQADGINIAINSQVTPIPLNQMHSWVITLRTTGDEPLENASIQLEGGMPLHDHGLATSPQVTNYLGDGRYLIEGLRFHMPGEWLMLLQINHMGRSYRSEARFELNGQTVQPLLNSGS